MLVEMKFLYKGTETVDTGRLLNNLLSIRMFISGLIKMDLNSLENLKIAISC